MIINKNSQELEIKSISNTIIEVLDTVFLKALTDPTRVQIIKKLVSTGVCDVTTVAKDLSQDRSVISRHLLNLEKEHLKKDNLLRNDNTKKDLLNQVKEFLKNRQKRK